MPDYQLRKASEVFSNDVEDYWVALSKADLLKYRFCDTPEACVEDAMQEHGHFTYFVFDGSRIVGEFTFDNFTGRSARVHFSVHPDLTAPHKLYLAKTISDSILNQWTVGDQPYLESMYGMTPTENRAACIFVQRAGFKKVGILPAGCDYLGRISDAMLTIKQRVSV